VVELGAEAHIRSSGPGFFHCVIGGCTPAALAADWLTSLIDQNAGAWSSSPLAVQLEAISLAWLQDRPDGVPEEALDELNLAIGRAVLADGRVYVGTTAGRVGSASARPSSTGGRRLRTPT
jgi:hypothetical protein